MFFIFSELVEADFIFLLLYVLLTNSLNFFLVRIISDLTEAEPLNSPLQALSKLVPVPESLMSPDYRPSPLVGRINTPSTIPTPIAKTPAKIVQPVQRSPKLNRSITTKNKNNIANEARKGVHSPTPLRQRKVLGGIVNK